MLKKFEKEKCNQYLGFHNHKFIFNVFFFHREGSVVIDFFLVISFQILCVFIVDILILLLI